MCGHLLGICLPDEGVNPMRTGSMPPSDPQGLIHLLPRVGTQRVNEWLKKRLLESLLAAIFKISCLFELLCNRCDNTNNSDTEEKCSLWDRLSSKLILLSSREQKTNPDREVFNSVGWGLKEWKLHLFLTSNQQMICSLIDFTTG